MEDKKHFDVLKVACLKPSEISIDFVTNKKQFQLHHLLTEQRHKRTFNLSQQASKCTEEALKDILSVDEDITELFKTKDMSKVASIAEALKNAMIENKRIFVYGCGAAGRMSKQMESSFWRPFWERMAERYPGRFPNLAEALMGEMSGGDRALISSLEGLEDLQLVGKLQLEENKVKRGDVVIAFSGAGLSSAVVGAIKAARSQYAQEDWAEARKRLFVLFNNPEESLMDKDRCKDYLADEGITKVPICTGPQAITGSTRMQATTSAMYLLGVALEQAVYEYLLENGLEDKELEDLGFKHCSLEDRLWSFELIQKAVASSVKSLSKLTDLETESYKRKGRTIYWADSAIVSVFTDSTERSPTFRLSPLDQVDAVEKKCWNRVVTPEKDQTSAWRHLLRRQFKGMDKSLYEEPFKKLIEDPYLREIALKSLQKTGNDQEHLYDFSCSNINPGVNDVGIAVLMNDEHKAGTSHEAFLDLFKSNKKSGLIVLSSDHDVPVLQDIVTVPLVTSSFKHDPLQVRQHVALKMLLNAHSTCIMAKLGKLVGNTMTHVNPSNLKLVGRATWLVLRHVNECLGKAGFRLDYEQANAVLYEAMGYVKKKGQAAEVALSIVFVIEAFKRRKEVTWEEAEEALASKGHLEDYLR